MKRCISSSRTWGGINFENWHNQWISRGSVSPIYVDTYELLSQLLSLEGTWSIAPASVVEALQKEFPILVSGISNEIPPPDRIAYCVTHKYMSESARHAAEQFEAMVEEAIGKRNWI